MLKAQTNGAHLLGKALTQALDLPISVSKLTLSLEAGKPAAVEIEYFPGDEQLKNAAQALQAVAARYELIEVEQPKQS